MTLTDSALLGLIQGLTEFLPVSSSGHLILLREILHINTESGLAFDAVLQLATVLAVFVYFRQDIERLLRALFFWVTGRNVSHEDKKLLIGLAVGSIPAIIAGLLLEDWMDTIFRSATLVAITLILGSGLFYLAERLASQRLHQPDVGTSWWIGCFQALALIPGVSRSGATISGGLLLGLKREAAARFSFLLSIPVITGSGLKKLLDLAGQSPTDSAWTALALGFAVAFFVGLACIHFLLTFLKRHTLSIFIWYRLTLGIATLVILKLT